ncbi:MAG: 4a-hydroxytetrahydrobiopterin dehydratase [Candidatus Woesebacteria bacterium]|jgi:4a-hydroxytetrahydrobiopterin dehydratase
MCVLTDEQIKQALKDLNVAWSAIPGQGLVRVYETTSFSEGMQLVKKIAVVSDEHNHFPSINLAPNEVEITLSTPSKNGLTEIDVKLAKAIDEI